MDTTGTRQPTLIGGRYELVERRGAGGMAEVWRAHDERLDRDVAVKLLSGPSEIDDSQRRRVEREARALAALEHPNIVAVYDYGEDAGAPGAPVPYIVMELVDGPDLQQRLNAEGPLGVEETRSLLAGVLAAMARAGDAGIVHGDLKPANILLASGGPKVGDFGVARILDRETGLTTVAATPSFAAPEVLRGSRPTAASDVYSVGCVAFQMLTGRAPYEGNNAWEVAAKHIEAPLPSARMFRGDVPVDLDETIRRAMSKDPRSRPTVAELAKRIDPALPMTVPVASAFTDRQRDPTEALPSRFDASAVALWGPFAAWGSKIARRLRRTSVRDHRRLGVALAVLGAVFLVAAMSARARTERGVVIPDVRGAVSSNATTTLRTAGFVVSDVSYEPVSSGEPDRVLKTIPATGTLAARGSQVHVISSAVIATQPTDAPASAPASPRGRGKGAKHDEG